MKAIEFFSGIGAFHYACRDFGIEVVAAFDQGQDANHAYQFNFGAKPNTRNLDSIDPEDIPDADIWWMSPPCTPYTIRGAQRDELDPRAQSLSHLIELLADKLPRMILVENVVAFQSSQMYWKLIAQLAQLGYRINTRHLCSTMFGVPMKRPRVFVVAAQFDFRLSYLPDPEQKMRLDSYLNSDNSNGRLNVPAEDLGRYSDGMNVLDLLAAPESTAICFTSGYGVSYKSAGSFIRTGVGDQVRRFAPEEILALLGFGPDFNFPSDLSLKACWRLAGNSVDVRCIRHLLHSLEANSDWVRQDHDSTAHC